FMRFPFLNFLWKLFSKKGRKSCLFLQFCNLERRSHAEGRVVEIGDLKDHPRRYGFSEERTRAVHHADDAALEVGLEGVVSGVHGQSAVGLERIDASGSSGLESVVVEIAETEIHGHRRTRRADLKASVGSSPVLASGGRRRSAEHAVDHAAHRG